MRTNETFKSENEREQRIAAIMALADEYAGQAKVDGWNHFGDDDADVTQPTRQARAALEAKLGEEIG